MRVVEFYGVPGAGKTAVASALCRELEVEGIPTRFCRAPDGWREHGYAPLSAYRPVVAQAALLAATTWPPKRAAINHARRLVRWVRCTGPYEQRDGPIVIYDQGALQMINAIVLQGHWRSPGLVRSTAARIAAHSRRLFVRVAADRETVLARRRRRTGRKPGTPAQLWRFRSAGPAEEEQIQRELEEVGSAIDAGVRQGAGDRCLTLVNSADGDAETIRQMAKGCARWIRSHMHGPLDAPAPLHTRHRVGRLGDERMTCQR